MRGCFVSLLLWLAGAALSVAAVLAFLHYRQGIGLPDAIGPSIFAGILAWLSLVLLRAAARSWREKAALDQSIAGAAPVDGQPFAFVGTLVPLTDEILHAPFDGAPCLFYDYAITEVRGSGKRRTVINYFRGAGLAPSAVATRSGTYPLLAVAQFQGEAPPITAAQARGPFQKYRETTAFQPKEAAAKDLEQRWSDADGSYRSDLSYLEAGSNPSLANATFTQHHAAPGAAVCVFGLYAAGRGIVPYENWAQTTRLQVGGAEVAARTLGSQVRTLAIVGLLLAGAAAGIIFLLVPAQA